MQLVCTLGSWIKRWTQLSALTAKGYFKHIFWYDSVLDAFGSTWLLVNWSHWCKWDKTPLGITAFCVHVWEKAWECGPLYHVRMSLFLQLVVWRVCMLCLTIQDQCLCTINIISWLCACLCVWKGGGCWGVSSWHITHCLWTYLKVAISHNLSWLPAVSTCVNSSVSYAVCFSQKCIAYVAYRFRWCTHRADMADMRVDVLPTLEQIPPPRWKKKESSPSSWGIRSQTNRILSK